ncbi:MFS transporter [Cohnella abietis]|nr:MFS transporter [Cohnella abietis]
MALITAISLFGDSMLYIALPIHWREAGLTSLVEVGILLSANRFIRLPLNPLISWIFTKLSIRDGMIIAVIIAGTTTFLYGWANSFLYWLILRCIWGIAWSIIRLGAYFMIFDSTTIENRGHLMGTYNGISRLGTLVGMLAGGFFVEWFGIRNVAVLFGILAIMVLPAVLIYIPNTKNRQVTLRTKLTVASLANQPILVWMLLTVFIVMLCLEGILTASLSHLIDVRKHMDFSFYGMLIGAAAIAATIQASRLVIGAFLSPWIGKKTDGKWGREAALSVILFLASVMVFVIPSNIPLGFWLLNLLALLLTTTLLITIMDISISAIVSNETKVAIVTVYVIVADVGASFGPFLGYLFERTLGLSTTYWIAATVLMLLSFRWMIALARRV